MGLIWFSMYLEVRLRNMGATTDMTSGFWSLLFYTGRALLRRSGHWAIDPFIGLFFARALCLIGVIVCDTEPVVLNTGTENLSVSFGAMFDQGPTVIFTLRLEFHEWDLILR